MVCVSFASQKLTTSHSNQRWQHLTVEARFFPHAGIKNQPCFLNQQISEEKESPLGLENSILDIQFQLDSYCCKPEECRSQICTKLKVANYDSIKDFSNIIIIIHYILIHLYTL